MNYNIFMSAICITIGEQSENHFGMEKNGNGLSNTGYNLDDLKTLSKITDKFSHLTFDKELIFNITKILNKINIVKELMTINKLEFVKDISISPSLISGPIL